MQHERHLTRHKTRLLSSCCAGLSGKCLHAAALYEAANAAAATQGAAYVGHCVACRLVPRGVDCALVHCYLQPCIGVRKQVYLIHVRNEWCFVYPCAEVPSGMCVLVRVRMQAYMVSNL